jgi:hypothetical protein
MREISGVTKAKEIVTRGDEGMCRRVRRRYIGVRRPFGASLPCLQPQSQHEYAIAAQRTTRIDIAEQREPGAHILIIHEAPASRILLANQKMFDKLQPESTDKDVMEGKDRLGDGSANWQFAPLDQRSLCQAQALSSVPATSTNVRQRKRRKLPVCATFFDRSFPSNVLHLKGVRTKLSEPL